MIPRGSELISTEIYMARPRTAIHPLDATATFGSDHSVLHGYIPQSNSSSTIILSLSQMFAVQYTSSLSRFQTSSLLGMIYIMHEPAMLGCPSGNC